MVAAASKPTVPVATKYYKKAAVRDISNRQCHNNKTKLYPEVGPGTTKGEAINLREAGVGHHGIDHSTPRHVYQYVETNLSQLAGAHDTSQRSPVHEESSSQKNQVSHFNTPVSTPAVLS